MTEPHTQYRTVPRCALLRRVLSLLPVDCAACVGPSGQSSFPWRHAYGACLGRTFREVLHSTQPPPEGIALLFSRHDRSLACTPTPWPYCSIHYILHTVAAAVSGSVHVRTSGTCYTGPSIALVPSFGSLFLPGDDSGHRWSMGSLVPLGRSPQLEVFEFYSINSPLPP